MARRSRPCNYRAFRARGNRGTPYPDKCVMSSNRLRPSCLLILFLLALPATAHAGQVDGAVAARKQRRDDFEARVEAELSGIAPDALPLLRKAEAARRARNLEPAAAGYRALLDKVPGFTHAQRRLCEIESSLGHRNAALELCNAALAADHTPENAATTALVLMIPGDSQPTSADRVRADELATNALTADPDNALAWGVHCQLANQQNAMGVLSHCGERLRQLEPDQPAGYVFSAAAAAAAGRWSAARDYAERAHALGLDDETYGHIDDIISEHEPLWPTILGIAGLIVGVWLGVMLLIAIAGGLLSRRTFRAANATGGASADAPIQAASASLRRVYSGVLHLSCIAYYLSMPFVLGLVILAGGGTIFAFFEAGYIPIKLVILIGIVTVVTVGAIVKSMFVRGKDQAPGTRLELEHHPELAAVLREVAQKIGTRPVDNVYMTPGVEVAVLERGSVGRQLRHTSERCLVLGAAALDGMPLPAFKAILAHEYGHFTNRDTAGGGFALAVRRSMMTMAIRLAESGAAAWYNPAWLFFRAFNAVFQRISGGATRLQEILADRWAVIGYGANHFETGLRHVIERSVRFDHHVNKTLAEVTSTSASLRNLYTYEPGETPDEQEVAREVEAAINREPRGYDTHPRPIDRFRWAHAIGAAEPKLAPGEAERDAWSLMVNREGLEQHMTGRIRDNVMNRYGVYIAGGE